jgi:heme-degrading monooxygenase HmoA
MIVRKWRGWADKDRADGYVRHFAAHVQAKLGTVRGYRRALVLTREQGGETEIVTMTFFDRLEDVKGFAGERYEVANVDPVAQGLLSRYDKSVTHFEVALELEANANTEMPTAD